MRLPWYTQIVLIASVIALAGCGVGGSPATTTPVDDQTPVAPGTYRALAYDRPDGHEQLLDLWVPAGRGPFPVVVFIHGGGWSSGSRTDADLAGLSSLGYVTASIDYRLTDVAPFPAQIQDCCSAIRWLRLHAATYSIDPARVGAWGGSAGAQLAALIGLASHDAIIAGTGNPGASSAVQAVVDYSGPADLIALWAAKGGDPLLGPMMRALVGGAAPPDRPELSAMASPITWVGTRAAPPFQIMHGDADSLVPVAQSQALARALLSAGISCELTIWPGKDHDLGADPIGPTILFLDRILKPPG